MKPTLLLILMAVCFAGCYETYDSRLSNMKSPVVIIGTDHKQYILLKDSTGKILTAVDCGLQYALSSRNVGDTIK